MAVTIPVGRRTRLGEQVTDYPSGRVFTLRPCEGDTTCPTCGGLVRNWTCYTLLNQGCRRGAERYSETPMSRHMLSNGLLGPCPEGGA